MALFKLAHIPRPWVAHEGGGAMVRMQALDGLSGGGAGLPEGNEWAEGGCPSFWEVGVWILAIRVR